MASPASVVAPGYGPAMLAADTDRQVLGQWFTPPALADLVVALASDGRRGLEVLDPTCGEGVFLDRAKAAGHESVRGLELDPALAESTGMRHPGVTQGSLFDADPQSLQVDLVVGNPPYVRQDRVEEHTRQRAQECVSSDWPENPELQALGRRSDLAALCIARMLRLVRPGGRLGLVISSALFDAGSARSLWLGVQKAASIVAVLESPDERWFSDAAVNAVIVILERGARARPFPIVRLREPVAEVAARVSRVSELHQVAEIREARPDRPETWAALLRADAAWFDLRMAAGSSLIPLHQVADIRRGVTSGANEVFYMTRDRAAELGLEPGTTVPLVRSPREQGADSIVVAAATTPHVALAVGANTDPKRRFPMAWRYLMSHSECAKRPTLRAREPWWSLPTVPVQVFLTKAYGARFVQRFAREPVACDQRVYAVEPIPGVDVELFAGILNSTYTAFALESLGRASLGQGALEWTVADARDLPIADPRALNRGCADRLRAAFRQLCQRSVGSVEQEAGCTDRLALDLAVAEILGDAATEQLPRIRSALIASVRRRARKATSLKRP